MTPLGFIWIASGVAAILVWSAGFLWGRGGSVRAAATARDAADAEGTARAEAEALRVRLRQVEQDAQARVAESGDAMASSAQAAEASRARADHRLAEVQQQREQAHQRAAQAELQVERARKDQAEVQTRAEQVEREAERLRKEAEHRHQEVVRLRRAREADASRLAESQARIERLQQEMSSYQDLLGAAQEVEKLRVELSVAERRMTELDRLRDHNAELEARAQAAVTLKSQLAEAMLELEELRALQLGAAPASPSLDPAIGPPLQEGSSAVMLDQVMRRVAAQPGHRSSVLADELGFPIVGYGIEQEALAALCGVLIEVRDRVRGLLPMGAVDGVTLETAKGLTVRAWADAMEGGVLTLATLTAGPGLDSPDLKVALRSAREALTRSEPIAQEMMT